jgi:ribosomal protein S27AE
MNSGPQSGEPMICPRCGAAMNHHADKALYFNEGDETRAADSATGAFVEQIHACPNCGASACRPATD